MEYQANGRDGEEWPQTAHGWGLPDRALT